MIWDERLLGPVWTHIEVLGRVFGRFCLTFWRHMHAVWWLQWYRYEIQISYWDTVIQICDTDQLLRYNDTGMGYISVIEIHRYNDTNMRYRQLRYRWDTCLWGSSEYTQRLWAMYLGAFVLWGLDYACTDMMRYEIVFPCLSV